jgi:hypothetical protein
MLMDKHRAASVETHDERIWPGAAGARYFKATALAGNLHLNDLGDWDLWQPSRLDYRDEAEVRWLLRASAVGRRIVRTVAELATAVEDSASSRSIYLYIHETLLEDARCRWEETKRNRNKGRAVRQSASHTISSNRNTPRDQYLLIPP